MADNDTFQVNDSKEFMGTLDQAISKIQKVSQVTNTANSRLKQYAHTFDELNAKMAQYVNISNGVRPVNGSTNNRPSNNRSSNNSNRNNGLGNGKFANADKILNGVTQFAKAAKAGNVSAAASSAAKLTTLLGSKMVLASGALGASLVALTKITIDASKQTTEYSRALKQMGVQLNYLEKSSLNNANNLNKISNQIGNAFQSLGEVFEPILNMIVDGTAWLLELLGANDSESKTKIYGTQANISNSARQSGFSLSSSNALAGGTYKAALSISEAYGEQASDIAAKLAEAWLKGSDAAKEYGVVLNDNVLTGYMASKGIDIANVEITDAMKQYYRYQLMLEELSATNQDSMQDMIKEWTKLGITIDKTKGKLFSFDEVIQLSAIDNRIPEVLGGLYDPPDNGTGGIPPFGGRVPGSPVTEGATNLDYEYALERLKEISEIVYRLPNGVEIPIFITTPGIESLLQLQESLEYINKNTQGQVIINADVPNIMILDNLKKYLEFARQSNPTPVSIPIGAPGYSILPIIKTYLDDIGGTHTSTTNLKVNGLSQLQTAYNTLLKVKQLAQSLGGKSVGVSNPLTISSTTSTNHTPSASLFTLANKSGNVSTKTNVSLFGLAYTGSNPLKSSQPVVSSGSATNSRNPIDVRNEYLNNYISSFNKNVKAFGENVNSFLSGLGKAFLEPIKNGSVSNSTPWWFTGSQGLAPLTFMPMPGFASGGIGTKEVHNATLFENDKKEAIIPLETPAGIQYLADAMREAGAGAGSITVNVNMRGLDIKNQAEVEKFANQVAEIIDIQVQRRGALNYGGKF